MATSSGNGAAPHNGNPIHHPVPMSAEGVELRKFELQQRYLIYRHLITTFSVLVGLFLAPRCLTLLRDMVVPFAGEETVIDARIALSLTVAVSLVVTGLAWRVRTQTRLAEFEKQRADDLTTRLLALQEEMPSP